MLTIFVLLTGLSVSYSVKKRAETALFDRLQGLVYGILGATEINEQSQQLVVNDFALPDARLNLETAGLYAEIIGNGGNQLWESKSVSNTVVPTVAYSPIGDWIFERIDQARSTDVHRMQMATVWELESGEEIPFIVHVVSNADILSGQLRRFDQTLWLSLLASAIGLLLLQLWVLNRSLQPLRHIGTELHEIEQGTREKLNEDVPRELKPLANSINLLLVSEKNRHQQYRHLLDDLAHSLKTPLSVLKNLRNPKATSLETSISITNRSAAERSPTKIALSDEPSLEASSLTVIDEQASQMQSTIDRYLQRAAMRTPQYLSQPISPLPVIQKISASLAKIYHQPEPIFVIDVSEAFRVRLADVDLYEILGNVLENACKYGAKNIAISSDDNKRQIVIDDDGPGFPDKARDLLLERGTRADTATPGQGVGLAASAELLKSYGGVLELNTSPMAGARVILHF